MKVYTIWEDPFKGRAFSETQMNVIYDSMIEKAEYPTFEGWLWDMLRSGVFDVKCGNQEADQGFKKRIKQILPILKDLLSNASSGSECERDDIYAHTLDLMYAVEKYLDDND